MDWSCWALRAAVPSNGYLRFERDPGGPAGSTSFSRREGLIVRDGASPWSASADVDEVVPVPSDVPEDSVADGGTRVVTTCVTALEKNLSTRYITVSSHVMPGLPCQGHLVTPPQEVALRFDTWSTMISVDGERLTYRSHTRDLLRAPGPHFLRETLEIENEGWKDLPVMLLPLPDSLRIILGNLLVPSCPGIQALVSSSHQAALKCNGVDNSTFLEDPAIRCSGRYPLTGCPRPCLVSFYHLPLQWRLTDPDVLLLHVVL